MQEFIIEFITKYGYFAIFLLITVENIFPPIPSEIILTLGGYLTTVSEVSLNVWLVILWATFGSVLGAVILYFLGRILSKERLEKIFESKLGKLLRLKKEDVGKADKWFEKKGKPAVFYCRFIPIVRSLISIPAGMAKMRFLTFLILTTIGTLIWNIVLVYFGKFAGIAWEKVAGYFDIYSKIALILIIIVLAIIAFIFIKKRFINKENENPPSEGE